MASRWISQLLFVTPSPERVHHDIDIAAQIKIHARGPGCEVRRARTLSGSIAGSRADLRGGVTPRFGQILHISGTEMMSIPPDLSPWGGMGDAPAGTDFGTRGGSPGRGEATLLVVIVTIIAVAVEVAIAQSCRRQQGDGCHAAGMQGESGERSSFQDGKTKYRATQEDGGKKEEGRNLQVCCILV